MRSVKAEFPEGMRVNEKLVKGLFIGLAVGLFLGAYALNWVKFSPAVVECLRAKGLAGQFYGVRAGQLYTVLAIAFIAGAAIMTILQYPYHRLKRQLLRGRGDVVAILFRQKSGNIHLLVSSYAPEVEIKGGKYELVEPAFTWMGMPGYILHEGCSVSLAWNDSDIEKLKTEYAAAVEKASTVEEGGVTYTMIPRAWTLAALSPVMLKEMYSRVYRFALSSASTRAERMIRVAVAFSAIGMAGALAAAYFGYYSQEGLQAVAQLVGQRLAEVKALLTASGGGAGG
ncbi:MAG: hypothetical protein GXO68_03715 [Crenarchaeota archaeon]|nr:hypothetical protein [Thermoproteota archaeon]